MQSVTKNGIAMNISPRSLCLHGLYCRNMVASLRSELFLFVSLYCVIVFECHGAWWKNPHSFNKLSKWVAQRQRIHGPSGGQAFRPSGGQTLRHIMNPADGDSSREWQPPYKRGKLLRPLP